jgi:hypothetical protein
MNNVLKCNGNGQQGGGKWEYAEGKIRLYQADCAADTTTMPFEMDVRWISKDKWLVADRLITKTPMVTYIYCQRISN